MRKDNGKEVTLHTLGIMISGESFETFQTAVSVAFLIADFNDDCDLPSARSYPEILMAIA